MYDPSLFRLDGDVALITGGGAGIGRSIAETFAAAGAAVTVTDRDPDAAELVARAIAAAGGRAVSVPCDVTKESDLEAGVNRTVEEFGKLTILVNNAGGGGPKPFDMPMSDMRFAYELNLFSLFRLWCNGDTALCCTVCTLSIHCELVRVVVVVSDEVGMMARLARAEVFAADEVAIVHVMNRTVRRCFLLGDDPVTGKNYDHRKQWIDDQLVHQARYFGIDLLCQAIMSNHFHLVLRSRPDVVAEWDDSEVARRWLMLCPLRRDEHRQPLEPTEEELNSIRKDKDKLQQVRARLSDISWWMRLLSQNIAQRANRDDEGSGQVLAGAVPGGAAAGRDGDPGVCRLCGSESDSGGDGGDR
jgi:hypothetical protein